MGTLWWGAAEGYDEAGQPLGAASFDLSLNDQVLVDDVQGFWPFTGGRALIRPSNGALRVFGANGKAMGQQFDLPEAGPVVAQTFRGERAAPVRVINNRFAARRGDTCGWLDLDGKTVGGFEPGMKNCAPPFDGKGWASTPDGWRFYDLD